MSKEKGQCAFRVSLKPSIGNINFERQITCQVKLIISKFNLHVSHISPFRLIPKVSEAKFYSFF